MDLLNYTIPPFKTIAWVSDQAKKIWKSRFNQISEAVLKTSIQALSQKAWDVQYLVLEGRFYFYLIELTSPLEMDVNFKFIGDKNSKGSTFQEVLLRNRGQAEKVQSDYCWQCSESWSLENRNRKELVWESALNTVTHTLEDNVITLPSSSDTSVFWQRFLVTVGPQHRCNLQCEIQQKLQRELIAYMLEYGFEAESYWLREIYSWPIEWSAKHGICELRTPIVKLAYDTDATAKTYTIQVEGETYPEEGATGKRFPYRQRSFLRVTDSKSFKRGLQLDLQTAP